MEIASLKKVRKITSHGGHGVLLIFTPTLNALSTLSGCAVTRPENAKFAPKRTNQEKQLFIKSMLSKYANGQSFTSSTHDDKKLTMEDSWCGEAIANTIVANGFACVFRARTATR
jgi:hypothetical protein